MAHLCVVVVRGGRPRCELVVEVGLRWPAALLGRGAGRRRGAPPPAFAPRRHGGRARGASIDHLHQSPVTSHSCPRRVTELHASEFNAIG